MQKLTSAYSLTDEKVSFEDYLNKSDVLYVSENKKIATKLVGQISFHQNGVPMSSNKVATLVIYHIQIKVSIFKVFLFRKRKSVCYSRR